MRLLPRSLFWRLTLVLAAGLIVAQLLSAALNLAERDRLLLRVSGMQPAQRIADIVRLLDPLNLEERRRIVGILNTPALLVTLDRAPIAAEEAAGPMAAMFSAMLRAALVDDRQIRVALSQVQPRLPPDFRRDRHERMMAQMLGGRPDAPGRMFFMTQVRLRDGSWVTFDTRVPKESASLPLRLALTLLVLLVTVLLLSLVAVRWLTRPLHVLAAAADELGRDINRPPLPEEGPLEVRSAAQAFNKMQARLVRFIEDRTRMLAAMSHDLKTPITRMRLRAELLEDEEVRDRFEKDLIEMEVMVTQTLDFMKGLDKHQALQPIDVMALLESLQSDYQEMGREVSIEGEAKLPCLGVPQLLKRCIANLLDNAVNYGKRARIVVEEGATELVIRIADEGPGLQEAELEKVFEPFYRVEGSRSRETGGTGLGLAIARNIAQTLGGDLRLANRPQGGLEAILSLPRRGTTKSPAGIK
ncbi:osmolarity sensor protein EnvZ [mine drainage metagenome]|uniref:histidine kinase n=1 Tax=mine drainage metagenome TaxID=410659 RepID=A0A1J5SGM3_9ZZZZ